MLYNKLCAQFTRKINIPYYHLIHLSNENGQKINSNNEWIIWSKFFKNILSKNQNWKDGWLIRCQYLILPAPKGCCAGSRGVSKTRGSWRRTCRFRTRCCARSRWCGARTTSGRSSSECRWSSCGSRSKRRSPFDKSSESLKV